MTKTCGIIVGAKNFSGNPYDGDALESTLSQVKAVRGTAPEIAYCDRGFRGRKCVGGTNVSIPGTPQPEATEHERRKARKNFARRSAIEPIIGHLKSEFRLARNFLKGSIGDAINLLMAATAFNCRKWMRALAHTLYFALLCLWARVTQGDTQSLTVG